MCVSSMSSRAPTKASEPRQHNMPRGRRDCSCRPLLLPRACLRTEAGGKTQCAASAIAPRCISHRTTLHQPSHHAASAIAPLCTKSLASILSEKENTAQHDAQRPPKTKNAMPHPKHHDLLSQEESQQPRASLNPKPENHNGSIAPALIQTPKITMGASRQP